ncbi:YCF48-related protein [Fontimonas sp. SYSU GA230001]|uniref:WD40/YVTN/BNR-like repeat-containing protein n=1 Tax=Fontimonas sp. SYSU GA230001 TaxID=3142450 RepID=UPI0032B5ADD6
MSRHNVRVGIACGLLMMGGAPLFAQDAEVTDTSLAPRPAVMAPRAATSLLLDVARAGDHWVVAGQRGNILRSTDGRQWQQVPVPVDATLTRLRFLDSQRGWAVGYDGTVLATTDGGRSWSLLQHDASWAKPYFDILFFDPDHGLLAGANGALLATADGGRTWTPVATDALEDQPNLYNLVPLNDGSLLLAGERGFLARSTDRGATWQRLRSPYTGSYFGALAVGARGAVIFGLRGNAFHAADVAAVPSLSAADLQAMNDAALDPEAASAGNGNGPVSAVPGWTPLRSGEFESLFGGTVAADGRVLLFGMNGHIMQADLASGELRRLPVAPDNNMNAGVATDGDVIVVGTAGVQRLALTP